MFDLPPWVLLITVLDALDPVLEALGDLTGLDIRSKTAVDQLVVVHDAPDRADNSGGTGTEHLQHAAFPGSLGNLTHVESALADLPALRDKPLLCELKDGVPCNTLEDRSVKRRSHELFLTILVDDGGEEVHGADLCDEVLELAGRGVHILEQPEVLLEAAGCGLHLRDDAGCVVGTELAVTDTARPCAIGKL